MSARPGRVVQRLEIDLARPRGIETMSLGRFGEYALEIRNSLASAAKDDTSVISHQ
jgi:hypothetical protein